MNGFFRAKNLHLHFSLFLTTRSFLRSSLQTNANNDTLILFESSSIHTMDMRTTVDTKWRCLYHWIGLEPTRRGNAAQVLSAQPVPISGSAAELLLVPKNQQGAKRLDLQA